MKTNSPSYKRTDIKPIWCPGCGDYSVLAALQKSFTELELAPEEIAMVSGIGCSGRFSHYFNSYSLHGTHGRALPTAIGIKAVRDDLTVIVAGGDGDGLSIGGGHLAHAARKNVDLTYILFDNNIYGLTKGQSSPTTPVGVKTATAPYGTYEEPLNPLAMFLAYDISFVALTRSIDLKEMQSLLTQAIQHKGFSLIYVLSPCVTYKVLTYEKLKEMGQNLPADYDYTNKRLAFEYAYKTDKIYTGLYYKKEAPCLNRHLDNVVKTAARTMSPKEVMEDFK